MSSLFLNLIMSVLTFAPVVEHNGNTVDPVDLTFIETQKPFQYSQLPEILELFCVNKEFRDTINAMKISRHRESMNANLLLKLAKALSTEWQSSPTWPIPIHNLPGSLMRLTKLMLADIDTDLDITYMNAWYSSNVRGPNYQADAYRGIPPRWEDTLELCDNDSIIKISTGTNTVMQDISDPAKRRTLGCAEHDIRDVLDLGKTPPLQFHDLPTAWIQFNSPHDNISVDIGTKLYRSLVFRFRAPNRPDIMCNISWGHLLGQDSYGRIEIQYKHTECFIETFYSLLSHPRLTEAIKFGCKVVYACADRPLSDRYDIDDLFKLIENTTGPHSIQGSSATMSSISCDWYGRRHEVTLSLAVRDMPLNGPGHPTTQRLATATPTPISATAYPPEPQAPQGVTYIISDLPLDDADQATDESSAASSTTSHIPAVPHSPEPQIPQSLASSIAAGMPPNTTDSSTAQSSATSSNALHVLATSSRFSYWYVTVATFSLLGFAIIVSRRDWRSFTWNDTRMPSRKHTMMLLQT